MEFSNQVLFRFRRRFNGGIMKVFDDQDYHDGAIWCSGRGGGNHAFMYILGV